MIAHPVVKWVGGKTQLLPAILSRIPADIDTYVEPFAGGLAVFFALYAEVAAGKRQVRRFVLSDVNEELITTYTAIRDNVDKVVKTLQRYADNYNVGDERDREQYYYAIRDLHENHGAHSIAARMIFLNKTCFNGLYRVNRNGKFNTPWGKKTSYIPDVENIRAVSEVFRDRRVKIECSGFQTLKAGPGGVVFLDPPYVPVSVTSNFTGYTQGGFGPAEQKELVAKLHQLDRDGAAFILTNAHTSKALYRGFKIESVSARRAINSKGARRGAIEEIIVSN